MIRNWYGDRCIIKLLLHHDMTTALPHLKEAVVREDGADLFSGEDTKLTQRPPPFELHTLPRVSASESPRARLFRKITPEPP